VSKSDKTRLGILESRRLQGNVSTVESADAGLIGILDSIDIPIIVVNLDCNVVHFNRAAVESIGVDSTDIGRPTCDLPALAPFPELEQACRQVMLDGLASQHDIRNGDRWFLVRISPSAGGDRRVAGAVLTFTNVTAFRASLGQAIYEREYTKTILNTIIDPLVVLNEDLQVQTANRAFYHWFGASREHTQGAALSDMGDGAWKSSSLWPSLRATLSDQQEFETIEFEGTFSNIGRRTVLLDARRLARDGTALILLAFRDITERNNLNRQRELLLAQEEGLRVEAQTAARVLIQTQDSLQKRIAELAAADKHKNEFLAILAHELRNPLAPLRNAVQILHRSPGDELVAAKARDLIDRQVHHMSRMVNDLLDAARAQNGQIKLQRSTLDLRSSIEHVVELMRPVFADKNQTLRTALPEVPIWVDGDATRLEQIFTNLLSNANKYTQERGDIEISLSAAAIQEVSSCAVIRVTDNGEGIEADLVPRLFQLFTQADRSLAHSGGGLGIGLSLVRTLVEMHGGRVTIRSEGRNRGCTFEVRIPMTTAPSKEAQSETDTPVVQRDVRLSRVLVVEDNVDIRESTCELLGLAGYEATGASTGYEALQMAAAFAPTVILLDVGLPDLNGYEVARRFREMPQFANTLLIAITGYDTPEAHARSAAAGFDHHICKPVNFGDLEGLLR
jgi:two-component system CheB/CheR fusion protein